MRSLKIGNLKPRVPIISGGMAVEISMAELVAAVANEGGIGLLPASGLKPKRLIKEIRLARELADADGIIGVNVMMAVRECKELSSAAIDEGIDLLVIGAGFGRDLFVEIISEAHENNTPVAYIVSSSKAANLAQNFNKNFKFDAIIAEGCHAGGHLGTIDKSIWQILPKIIDSVSVPVIAAGGCGTREGFQKAMQLGASGVQIGTRFALSKDTGKCVSKTWQRVLLNAEEEDIVVLNKDDNELSVGSPVGMPLRVVKTPAVKILLDKGVVKMSVHRSDCIRGCLRKRHCKYRDSNFTESFCIFEGLRLAKEGDRENGIFTLGEQAKEITGSVENLPTIKEIIDELTS